MPAAIAAKQAQPPESYRLGCIITRQSESAIKASERGTPTQKANPVSGGGHGSELL
ncbi:MAG: hypothetical protein WBB01_13180 [Phormidesmis sp.]